MGIRSTTIWGAFIAVCWSLAVPGLHDAEVRAQVRGAGGAEHSCLDCGSGSYHFIRVHSSVWFLAKQLLDQILNRRNSS